MKVDDDIKITGTDVEPDTAADNASDAAATECEEAPDPMEVLQEKLAATHDRFLRTAAELDNFRKRARRDVEETLNRGRADVLVEILPVMDSVDLALSSVDEGSSPGLVEGLQMIKRQFLSAVERFGVKPVDSRGKAFDPNLHEAVSQVCSDSHPAGQIVEEMRKGYLIGEKLLRPAMVMVSRGTPPSVEEATPLEDESATDTDNEMNPVEPTEVQ